MVKVYVALIRKGLIMADSVPLLWRAQVEEAMSGE